MASYSRFQNLPLWARIVQILQSVSRFTALAQNRAKMRGKKRVLQSVSPERLFLGLQYSTQNGFKTHPNALIYRSKTVLRPKHDGLGTTL